MNSNTDRIRSIDAYIAAFPAEIQGLLEELRATIRAAAPDASEKISYQMPTFAQQGNLVHFAVHKQHIGLYPAPSAIEAFREELAAYETSKGAVRFPFGQPLPLDLIGRIVRFRVAENLRAAQAKSRPRPAPHERGGH